MIHTFKLFFILNYDEVQDLQKRFNIKYTEFNEYFAGSYPGVTMSICHCQDGKWRLYMVVDVIELLGTPEIGETNYASLENELRYILSSIFGHSAYYKDHVLIRIDYRYDYKVKDKNERMLLMSLYKKLTKSRSYQKKYLGKLENGVYVPYETTVYHESKSIGSMVYLKEEERIAKEEEVKWYEKDIIRFEVHVKRDHLYYMENKNKRYTRPRKLSAYMQDEVYKEYFRKYLFQIYHPGDYYKVDAVRKKLQSSNLSTTNKLKLIDFLKMASSYSVDTPLSKMSKGTYNSRLALLREVGVNPILIPKNHTPKAPAMLKNPLDDFPR